jgi:gluconate kinase
MKTDTDERTEYVAEAIAEQPLVLLSDDDRIYWLEKARRAIAADRNFWRRLKKA